MGREAIEKKVIEYLRKCEWPVTTGDVAKAAAISWNTAQVHLMSLQMKGHVKFRKVGRQNQWWLDKSFKKNFGD